MLFGGDRLTNNMLFFNLFNMLIYLAISQDFEKSIRIALVNKWMDHDPFINNKVQFDTIEREFLIAEMQLWNIKPKKQQLGN